MNEWMNEWMKWSQWMKSMKVLKLPSEWGKGLLVPDMLLLSSVSVYACACYPSSVCVCGCAWVYVCVCSRIQFYASVFQSLAATQAKFHSEMTKVDEDFANLMDGLASEAATAIHTTKKERTLDSTWERGGGRGGGGGGLSRARIVLCCSFPWFCFTSTLSALNWTEVWSRTTSGARLLVGRAVGTCQN